MESLPTSDRRPVTVGGRQYSSVNFPSPKARRIPLVLAAALVLGAAGPLARAQSYTAVSLGTLGGSVAYASGINDSGTIVGYSTLAGGSNHAFKYSAGAMTDLGTLGGTVSHANAVNSGGIIVGNANYTGDIASYAFQDKNGLMTSLGALNSAYSEAEAINASATIVGISTISDGVTMHAFSDSSGTMSDLGTLGGPNSQAYGINSSGTIVGRADYGSATTAHHAFSYSNGNMTDLGSLAGTSSNAYSINDSGVVVGYSATTSGGSVFHAVSYINGAVTDLGSLGGATMNSRATGINNWGTIVGYSTNLSGSERGFIVIGGVMTDINTLVVSGLPLGVVLDHPSINNLGRIVANGSDSNAYLLTPVASPVTHLGVSTVASANAGATITVNVAALDAFNDTVTGYAGTVHFSSTDSSAVLPANSTLTNGTGTFTVQVNTGGTQTVTATDTVTGSITGVSAAILVIQAPTPPPPQPGRIVNLSARANVGTGGNALIAGFVINGSGTKSVLLRGIGPTLGLAPFNVAGSLATPQLTLVNSATMATVATATAWGGGAALSTAFAEVAAFPLAAGSADSAMLQPLPVGSYTSTVSGVNSTTGIALAEIYDEDAQPATSGLVNISARANVGSGSNVLIAGFVIEGGLPAKVLLRGIGPSLGLAPFNVTGFLPQPEILLFNSAGNELGGNQGWGGSATLSAAFTQVGAFSLPAGSADAAMISTLPPGSYTVQLSGQNGTTGIGLVEVYLIPQ
jgi:probable HAF family extracellular repeat protein